MQVGKASSAEKVSNDMIDDGVNDDTSTEVVQIVEGHEEVEEPQVLNQFYTIFFYIKIKIFSINCKKRTCRRQKRVRQWK